MQYPTIKIFGFFYKKIEETKYCKVQNNISEDILYITIQEKAVIAIQESSI